SAFQLQFFSVVNTQKSENSAQFAQPSPHVPIARPNLAPLHTPLSALDSDFPSLHSDVNYIITLLSKHYTQCSVVAHTSQVKSQSINLQHTNIKISKHSGRLSNLQSGLQHKSALSLCFLW